MAQVSKLVPYILKFEGGFVNDPDDLGGETYKGITFKTYKLYRQRKKLPPPTIEDLKRISDEEFTSILKEMYWDACRADKIESQGVANAIVDWGWNSGTVTAVKEIQKVLGVTSDGVIGNVTLAAINSCNPLHLFNKIQEARTDYIERICEKRPQNEKFRKGWMNRINSLSFSY